MKRLRPSFPATMVSNLRCASSATRIRVSPDFSSCVFSRSLPFLSLASCLTPSKMTSSHRSRNSKANTGSTTGGAGRRDCLSASVILFVGSKELLLFGGDDGVGRLLCTPDIDVGGGEEGGVEDDDNNRRRWKSPRNTLPILAMLTISGLQSFAGGLVSTGLVCKAVRGYKGVHSSHHNVHDQETSMSFLKRKFRQCGPAVLIHLQ